MKINIEIDYTCMCLYFVLLHLTEKKYQSFSAFDSLFNMQCITATGNIFIFCIIYCITCQSSIAYKLASGFLYKTGEGRLCSA